MTSAEIFALIEWQNNARVFNNLLSNFKCCSGMILNRDYHIMFCLLACLFVCLFICFFFIFTHKSLYFPTTILSDLNSTCTINLKYRTDERNCNFGLQSANEPKLTLWHMNGQTSKGNFALTGLATFWNDDVSDIRIFDLRGYYPARWASLLDCFQVK